MFFFDCETHIWPPMDDIAYYPNFKKYVQGLVNLGARLGASKEVADRGKAQVQADANALIASMDEGGVQMACVIPEIMIGLSHGHRVRSTNGWVAKEIARYTDRLIGVCNVGPIIQRGVKSAIWELDYLVKEMNFKACKFYPPEDTPINNRELWPFYEKIQELRVPLFIHTGMNLVGPGRSPYCYPILLEEVCFDFPEIPIVAYHMGYPYTDELNTLASMFNNLYIGTSLLPQVSGGPNKKAQELLGGAIRWAGIDKIIWGTDWSGSLSRHKDMVRFVEEFQIGKEVQEDYGYGPLSKEDKEKWVGLNLARIMKIDKQGQN
jgi:predicted TIM-barrel fold metal-dependent hydrolase